MKYKNTWKAQTFHFNRVSGNFNGAKFLHPAKERTRVNNFHGCLTVPTFSFQ
jgi:hypothetical protein